MLDSQQKHTGTRYTMTVTLILMAFIFSPAVLFVSRPFGYVAILLSLGCSALCVALAWFQWKNYSELTIPSIAAPSSGAK